LLGAITLLNILAVVVTSAATGNEEASDKMLANKN